MTEMIKALLGVCSIILVERTIKNVIRQNQAELDPVDLIFDFDNEYYDNKI